MRAIPLLVLTSVAALAADDSRLRDAAAKGIAALERGTKNWYRTQTCVSCHHQSLPLMAVRKARGHGVPVDEAHWREMSAKAFAFTQDLDQAVQYWNIIDPALDTGYMLLGMDAADVEPTVPPAVYARHIAGHQRPTGEWQTVDARPPQTGSRFTTTAVAARALQRYGRGDVSAQIAKARAWLESNQPRNTEDLTYRLLGLHWTGADAAGAAKDLEAAQRDDGGWAQLPSFSTDAYATGQALYALGQAGRTGEPYQRGLGYLVRTQAPDGTWRVKSRMHPPVPLSPPYFETGFPYGKDQFISAAATAWAVMALASGLPKSSAALKPIVSLPGKDMPSWAATALFGSADELRKLLDSGLDPNSRTVAGTSLLMMAVPDLDKTKLLIERGADVRASAKTGWTALMVASHFRGSTNVVKLLLEKGAVARPGLSIRNNGSPLSTAVLNGDPELVDTLLNAGADVNRKMLILGTFPATPYEVAVIQGDTDLALSLVKAGANLHHADPNGINQIGWSVISGYAGQVRALARAGGEVNRIDKFKMTPIDYAATYYHGSTDVISALLEAGAKPTKRTLALANKYGYRDIAELLRVSMSKPH